MSTRDITRRIAIDNHGVFTLEQAQEYDIDAQKVATLAHRGFAKRVASGVYRHLDVPDGKLTMYAIALGSVNEDAYLVDDSVLALFDLALVSPTKIHVQTKGRRPHKQLPANVVLERRTREDIKINRHKALRHMSVFDALRRAKKRLREDHLVRGIEDAYRKELITKQQEQLLLNA